MMISTQILEKRAYWREKRVRKTKAFLKRTMEEWTGVMRYVPKEGRDFEYTDDIWINNLFRIYEQWFGRRYGIKPYASCRADHLGNSILQFHCWEALFAHAEVAIRNFVKLPRFVPVRIYIPVLAPAGRGVLPSQMPYLLAIALDTNTSHVGNSGNNVSMTMTLTGSNLLVCAGMRWSRSSGSGDPLASMSTTNGSAAQVQSDFNSLTYFYTGVVTAPSAGASWNWNWNFSNGAGGSGDGNMASYTGCSSSQPDSFNKTKITSATSGSVSTTVVASNCWTFLGAYVYAGNSTLNASTGTTQRGDGAFGTFTGDSNGTVGTGSQSMALTDPSSSSWFMQIFSFAPVIPPLTPNVSDTTTMSESVTMVKVNEPSVSDSTAVSDTPTLQINSFPSVSDSTVVTDTPTIEIISNISVQDSSTVTDTPTIRLFSYINVQDSSTVTDTPTIFLPYYTPSVSDTTPVTDAPTIEIISFVSVSDTTPITDTPTIFIPTLTIQVSDTTLVTDTPTVFIPVLTLSVSDTSVMDDSAVFNEEISYVDQGDQTTMSEQVTIFLPYLTIQVQDDTAVTDTPNVTIPFLPVSASDTTVVTDTPTLEEVNNIIVQDQTVIGEAVQLGVPIVLSVTDTTPVSDTPDIFVEIVREINVQDTTVMSDMADVRRPPTVKYIVLQLGFHFGDYEMQAEV